MHAVAALNTIMGRWGLKASSEWNISGEPCSGFASDATDWDHQRNINPFIKCVCSYDNNTVCHITRLRLHELNVIGHIPSELQNLTYLVDLDMNYNYLTGAIPSFIGKFTGMLYLYDLYIKFYIHVPWIGRVLSYLSFIV
ncbi:hypothetical protein GUJ93_ZPchr0005g15538 [Zizania palustris]|uniref:Leucine-rich repeat-containing N-terminal plant-type domain-containing protein n=1 Tax=Zizania palustris TaxID=103762 RepID=A0A8J5S9L6_ZIZPA|nr:hypothetical protein GUJ93_ZPchr0005g15538 [Zizania palustris]